VSADLNLMGDAAPPRIVLAGGSGFLGGVLARHFAAEGREVLILTRQPTRRDDGINEVLWDGRTLGDWAARLDGALGVINLAGRSVNCRYHARNRREIMDSRVHSTAILGAAIAGCRRPPRIWFNSSTATIYRHSLDRPMDEATGEIGPTPEAKDAFSVEVAQAWEAAFAAATTPETRKVALRSAMVLGRGINSVFPMLRRLARFGLGGKMGSGRQFVSWIHEADFCRAIGWLIDRNDFEGAVNLAAPNPIPNRDMMQSVRHVCGLPFGLPAPGWALEAGAFLLGTETELILKSRRVIPSRLRASGFEFQFPEFEAAIREIENRTAASRLPTFTRP